MRQETKQTPIWRAHWVQDDGSVVPDDKHKESVRADFLRNLSGYHYDEGNVVKVVQLSSQMIVRAIHSHITDAETSDVVVGDHIPKGPGVPVIWEPVVAKPGSSPQKKQPNKI